MYKEEIPMKSRTVLVTMLLVVLMASSTVVYAHRNIDFGDPNFSTPGDANNHVVIPNDVTIKTGETLTLLVHGFHQPLVYRVPEDTTRDRVATGTSGIVRVDGAPILDTNIVDPLHAPPDFIHDHSDHFIAEGANPREIKTDVVDRDEGLSFSLTFSKPGRYLILCAVKPHFLNDDMFALVTVEPVEAQ